jgi:hypothetical protein
MNVQWLFGICCGGRVEEQHRRRGKCNLPYSKYYSVASVAILLVSKIGIEGVSQVYVVSAVIFHSHKQCPSLMNKIFVSVGCLFVVLRKKELGLCCGIIEESRLLYMENWSHNFRL